MSTPNTSNSLSTAIADFNLVFPFIKSVVDTGSTTPEKSVNLPLGHTSVEQLKAYATSDLAVPRPYTSNAATDKEDSQIAAAQTLLSAIDGESHAINVILTDEVLGLATVEGAARWYTDRLEDWYIRCKSQSASGVETDSTSDRVLQQLRDLSLSSASVVSAIVDILADPSASLGNLYTDMADISFILSHRKALGPTKDLSQLKRAWNALRLSAIRLRQSTTGTADSRTASVAAELRHGEEVTMLQEACEKLAGAAVREYDGSLDAIASKAKGAAE